MKKPTSIALIAVTRRGIEQASLLRQRLRLGDIYRPAHFGPVQHGWEHAYAGPLAEQVGVCFASHEQLVFFLAAGAVTRLLAPCLVSKESDPGVLAIDEAGQFVIPLLSGHRGGANAFARTVAGCLGATPVVTTASDLLGGLSLDLLEETFGWTAEPRALLKGTAMALVNKEPIAIVQEIGTRGTWLEEIDLPKNVTVLADPAYFANQSYTSVLCVTDRAIENANLQSAICNLQSSILWFRPKSLVLGVGCERGLSLEGLERGLELFLRQHGFAQACIDTLASVAVKADEPALIELADRRGWQTIFYEAEELAQVPGVRNPSDVVQRCVGTPGVAEPAALLAARTDHLLVEKQVVRVPGCTQAMTFALARHARFQLKSGGHGPHSRSQTPFGNENGGGKVYFVGAGPGDPQLLTLKAAHILGRAEVAIYAGSLIPEAVLRHVPGNAVLHNSAYLTLEETTEITLQAVRSGQRVVRLHSGDTSLYSAIQEQMAILEKENVDFEVVPGISSYQALAAALKSEFTLPEKVQTIILTRGEGNTPMPEKESLVALAQHQATLCIFLSALLADKVQAQLLTAYPPDTPVAIAHRISWPDEQIVVTRLDQLAAQMRQHAFRRTTLIVVGEAVGGRHRRSQLYDESHGHLFRKRKSGGARGEGRRTSGSGAAPGAIPFPLVPSPSPVAPPASPLLSRPSPLFPRPSRILLLSGTSEGPRLANALNEAGFQVRATVTRQEACINLFGAVPANVNVEARGFTEESLTEFLRGQEADLVLDATHPFAVRITRIAHGVCTRLGVPYVRYERPDWPAPAGTHLVDGFVEAAALLPDLGTRIMLTIGAKQLKHFAHLHERLTLFARILPSPISLQQALAQGFPAERVLGSRPPFSTERNRALFREHKVEVLVTKASGQEGGVVEKVTAARELGMHVVMIRRPVLPDMAAVSSLEAAVAMCRRYLA